MPDPYASIDRADQTLQTRLADVLELRAADPQQRAMLQAYLSELAIPSGARALEVGCGTGAVTRVLAEIPGIGDVVGVDPSPVFVDRARELGHGRARLSFQTGDGRSLPFPDGSFDLVVFHTTLCHVADPEGALREADRVLRADGWLAVTSLRSHGYTQTADPQYMLTDRGPRCRPAGRSPGRRRGTGGRPEGRGPSPGGAASEFFGHISFVSLIARKQP